MKFNISDFIKAIAFLLWPIIVLFLVWNAMRILTPFFEQKELDQISIKIGGYELTLKAATEEQQALINSMQADIIELKKKTNIGIDEEKEKNKFVFSGADKNLNNSMLHLENEIESIINNGLTKSAVDHVHQLVITHHNEMWEHLIKKENVPQHVQEAKALYQRLSRKLIEAPDSEFKGEFASAIGIMKNNMIGRIRGLRTVPADG